MVSDDFSLANIEGQAELIAAIQIKMDPIDENHVSDNYFDDEIQGANIVDTARNRIKNDIMGVNMEDTAQ